MEIERLLERHFNEGTSRKNVIDLEIQRLINWSFDQPEEKLKIYNESIHPQQAFSGIEKGSDQENYLFTLKLMAKRVKEYIHELEYLKVVTSESQQNLPKISITYCTSSDRSFEVHISGVGFPPDTGTITKVMFPNFSPIGSIAFRTDSVGNLKSFFGYTIDVPIEACLPVGKYIVNVFVGDKHEKVSGTLEAWTDFVLPYQNESDLIFDPIPDVPCGDVVKLTGRLTPSSWKPMAPRVHEAKVITFTGKGTIPHDVLTDDTGKFSATFTAPMTDGSLWSIQAHFAGDAHYKRSSSAILKYKTVPSAVAQAIVKQAPLEEQSSTEDTLIRNLSNCPKGFTSYSQFEEICVAILSHLFSPPLYSAKPRSRTEEGTQIRDIIIHIPHKIESGFWYWVQFYYQSVAIIVECKNYNDILDPREITIASKYFDPRKLGNFGLLISRVDIGSRAKKELERLFTENNKMIIPLTDSDLIEMLRNKKQGREPELVIDTKHREFRERLDRA